MKKIGLIIAFIILLSVVIVLGILKDKHITETKNNYIYQSSDLFTNRDLRQNVDLSNATKYTISDNNDIKISKDGIYIISGIAKNASVIIEAGDADKVQIILDNVSITNDNMPCVYIKTADKVFITLKESNNLKVTNTFTTDGENRLNAVIYSKQDIVLNGNGKIYIESSQNGITGKDDIKITGGTINIKADAVAIRANDSIRIANGDLTLNAGTDGLHAENSSDDSKGYIYICGGTIKIEAVDDCIHGGSVVQIDNGNINVNGAEGIEGTYIQINAGNITINATGDGINAGKKSNSYQVTIEIAGGDIKIETVNDDTDGIDSNGDLIISGGTVNIKGKIPFDYDGTAIYKGGTIIVNGVTLDSIPEPVV